MKHSTWEDEWASDLTLTDALDLIRDRVVKYDQLLEDYVKLQNQYQPYIDSGIDARLEQLTKGLRQQVNDWKGLAAFYKQRLEKYEGVENDKQIEN